MAANNNKLSEAKKLLDDIAKQYKSLGLTNPFKGVDEATANIKELEAGLKESHKVMKLMDEDAESLTSSFKSIVEEVKSTNTLYSNSTKSLSSMTSIAGKLRDHQQGLNNLSTKQLKSLQSKLKSEEANLKTNAKLLASSTSEGKQREKEIIALDNINGLLKEKESSLKLLDDSLSSSVQKQKEIERSTGVMGGVLKGISKIPILGDVFDANEAVEKMEGHLRGGGSALGAMGKGLKNMGGQVMSGLTNPANLALGAFTFILNTFKQLDSAAGDYAKSMNVTYGESLKVREEMSDIAASSEDTALNATNLQKTLVEVGNSLGTNAKLNEADLKTMTKLTNQAGFTADELMDIQKLSLGTGKSLESNTKEILGGAKEYARRNKIAVNEKTILKEVNKMSASLKLSLGGSGDAMAKAAIQAKKFGINLEQAESIASSLLDFESSIENELSAELLLGRNLNLEKARGLALNGDAAGAAAEMLKQVGSIAEYGELNVIQQESLAKAMGMSREELSKSLVESAALKSIGVDSVEKAQEKYDLLRLSTEEGGKGLSAEEAKKELGDQALASQFEQQSNAEKFAQTIEHLKEILISIVDGPMGALMAGVSDLLSNSTAVYAIFGGIAAIVGGKMVMGLGKSIAKAGVLLGLTTAKAAAEITAVSALTLGIGTIAVMAAAGAAIAGLYSLANPKKTGDLGMDPNGGPIVMSPKEGGIFQGTKNDGISMSPSHGVKGGVSKSQSGGTSVNVDMSQTNALLQQLISVISAGGDVVLDGQKVGNALNLVSYKTQ
jgi:hypothetical protein